jgi:hypothetical protein
MLTEYRERLKNKPGSRDLATLKANSERLAEQRERLANLSWFMFKQAAGRPSSLVDPAARC